MTNHIPPINAPWHFWLITVLAIVWYAGGCFDYVMTQTENKAYLEAFTAEQKAYFLGFPAWFTAVWAISVWGGLLATLLLLMKKKICIHVYIVAILFYLIAAVHNFVLTNGLEIMGTGIALVMSVLILVIGVFMVFYAKAMTRRGVID